MRPSTLSIIGFILPALSILFSPAVKAENFNGKINGYDCARAGISCPIDPKDPHIALETDFVLQQNGGNYLFLTNLPRKIKLQHVLKDARITGKQHAKFESIEVDKFLVKDSGEWKVVWSKSMTPEVKLETVTGRLNGHDCVHAGISCPVDPQDPHILLEKDYVLQQTNGDYLFLTNIPRSTKLQYILHDIQISGRLDRKYNTVEVYELMVMQDDEWKSVWIRRE